MSWSQFAIVSRSYVVNAPIFVFPFLGLFVTVGVLLADDQDSDPAARNSADSTAAELVEVLRGAVIAGEPSSLFELVGRSETIVKYDWGIDSTAIVDFRLQLDRKNEVLRCAVKVKKETFPKTGNRKEAPGELTFSGVSIQGGNLTSFSAGDSRPARAHFETFDEAMKAARSIPSPEYFGVVSYNLFRDGEKELKRLETLVMSPKTTIRVEALTEGVRYVARNQESDKRFVVYTWEFRLPDYVPQSLTIDQSITGELKRIRSQRLYWEKSPQGQPRPFRIAAENPAIRRKPGGYDIGRKSIDVELVWLAPQQINKMAFVNLIDIRKYLEIGEAIAKQKNSIPTESD
jgi:hypothetical protein